MMIDTVVLHATRAAEGLDRAAGPGPVMNLTGRARVRMDTARRQVLPRSRGTARGGARHVEPG